MLYRALFAATLSVGLAGTAIAADAPRNPQIDYAGFAKLTGEVHGQRAKRLIDLSTFKKMAKRDDVLILDARSARAFRVGHIKGAVNLPFPEFTAQSLSETIGDSDRPILIYCNNNFSNNAEPVVTKKVQLALNIQTFINLVGYGYANVYELNEVVDFDDPKVEWVGETGGALISITG